MLLILTLACKLYCKDVKTLLNCEIPDTFDPSKAVELTHLSFQYLFEPMAKDIWRVFKVQDITALENILQKYGFPEAHGSLIKYLSKRSETRWAEENSPRPWERLAAHTLLLSPSH